MAKGVGVLLAFGGNHQVARQQAVQCVCDSGRITLRQGGAECGWAKCPSSYRRHLQHLALRFGKQVQPRQHRLMHRIRQGIRQGIRPLSGKVSSRYQAGIRQRLRPPFRRIHHTRQPARAPVRWRRRGCFACAFYHALTHQGLEPARDLAEQLFVSPCRSTAQASAQ